jgi:hypothetical protein
MGLDSARTNTWIAVDNGEDEDVIVRKAHEWFQLFKAWESKETFDRALRSGRMTLRQAPHQPLPGDERVDPKTNMMKFDVANARGEKKPMNFNPYIAGLPDSLKPANFITKRKNELGIHEYSAILLNPYGTISTQVFAKPNAFPIFMPIPLEADLRLFDMLSNLAKRNRTGKLYPWLVEARARMTRITFGSATDMKVGFLRVDKGDGKDHFRYGHGTITGAVVDEKTRQIRRYDALHYKTWISNKRGDSSNNEVTIKYRQHVGGFPWVGNPGPLPAHPPYPPVAANDFVVCSIDHKPKGILKDDCTFTPFRV